MRCPVCRQRVVISVAGRRWPVTDKPPTLAAHRDTAGRFCPASGYPVRITGEVGPCATAG